MNVNENVIDELSRHPIGITFPKVVEHAPHTPHNKAHEASCRTFANSNPLHFIPTTNGRSSRCIKCGSPSLAHRDGCCSTFLASAEGSLRSARSARSCFASDSCCVRRYATDRPQATMVDDRHGILPPCKTKIVTVREGKKKLKRYRPCARSLIAVDGLRRICFCTILSRRYRSPIRPVDLHPKRLKMTIGMASPPQPVLGTDHECN